MLYILIGLAAGVLSGLFGIGGGIVIVPALLLVARFDPSAATGTSLGALLLPVGALGVWQYYRAGQFDVKVALFIALGLFIGAGLGANIALRVSPVALQRSFAVFLAIVSVRLWWTA